MTGISRRYCKRCGDYGPAQANGSNVVHLILTLLTAGLWLPVWLLAAIMPPYVCSRCGSRTGISTAWLWAAGLVIAGFVLWRLTDLP